MPLTSLASYTSVAIAGSGAAGNVDATGLSAQFNLPIGICGSLDGRFLYVAQWDGAIRAIDTNLASYIVTTFLPVGTVPNAAYIRTGPVSGDLYVVSISPNAGSYTENHTISRYRISDKSLIATYGGMSDNFGFTLDSTEANIITTHNSNYNNSFGSHNLGIEYRAGAWIDSSVGPSAAAFQWGANVDVGLDGNIYWGEGQFGEGLVKAAGHVAYDSATYVNALSAYNYSTGGIVYVIQGSMHQFDFSNSGITGPPSSQPTIAGLCNLANDSAVYATGTSAELSRSSGAPSLIVSAASNQIWRITPPGWVSPTIRKVKPTKLFIPRKDTSWR